MSQKIRNAVSLLSVAMAAFASSASGQITYSGTPLTENFDTLPTVTPTPAAFSHVIGTQAGIPGLTAWQATKVAGSSTATTSTPNILADTGTGGSGFLYSYGAASNSERALGALASGSNAMAFGTQITNNSGGTITSITISFTSEAWRSSTSVQNRLVFAYGIGAEGGAITASNFLTQTGMTAVPALDVVGPAAVATNGALDGNNAANQAAVSFTITGLSVPANGSIFIRWTDTNDAGNDAGLAIDNFTFNATVSTGGDVSRGPTTTFTPTSFGGNPFTANDNAVFDGTAATVNLSGAVAATSLKFLTNDYILAGTASDSITLSGPVSVGNSTVTPSATISATIAGSSGLTKIGPGTLTLSGNNTFAGNVNVSGGVLAVSSDSALGAAGNDIILGGALNLPGGTALGSGRDLSGTGTITVSPAGSLTIGGSLGVGAYTLNGLNSLTLAGTANTPTSLTFAEPLTLNITGGALVPASSINFNQTSGNTTIVGALNVTTGGDRTLSVAGGNVKPTGTFGIGSGRYIKTGAGVLDLTATTLSTANSTAGGIRLGVQGAAPAEGGTLIVDQSTDLGVSQLQFNSGTFQATQALAFPVGLSIGGRIGSLASKPTFVGGNVTFSGNSSFFAAAGASGDIGLAVSNTVTLTGNVTITTAATVAQPAPPINLIDLSGSGALVIGGDGSAVLDRFYINGGATLAINGTLGGQSIQVGSGSKLTGGGTYSGYFLNSTVVGVVPYVASSLFVDGGATLAPTGAMTVRASVSLDPSAIVLLEIDGLTRATEYDALTVEIPAGSTGLAYNLGYGGDLSLRFGRLALNGTYQLFSTGAGVTRSGNFSSVTLAGSHTGSMTNNSGVWTRTDSTGTTFSLDTTTGVLTVTGGVSPTTPLQDWRQANFGSTANSGNGADTFDFDGDGIPNLVEYATGTNPTVYNASVVTQGRSGDFLTLVFPRISDASLTYSVQASSDLASGFVTATGAINTVSNVSTYTDNVSLATPGVRRFLRLQVSYGQ